METENTFRISFAKEIEGYLNNKRCLYEAEGRREYLPLVDQALNLIKNMRNSTTAEPAQSTTFDRPSEKMYHYAEGEAIDCAICIEHVEANHAQVRLSCDYKCPYCRIEVDKFAKQPRIWEHPVHGPQQPQNQIDTNDMPHPGELDFANFQRGVLQVVNSIFGGRLNLGHPFRNDNGTEEDYYDNEDDSPSEIDDEIYETHYVESNDSDSSDDSDESEDDHEYDRGTGNTFGPPRNPYYSSSNETLTSSGRRTYPRGATHTDSIRSRSITRNRPHPESMSGSAFRRLDNLHSSRPPSFSRDITPRSEVNEMSRYRNDNYYPQRSDFNDMPRFHDQDTLRHVNSNNESSIYNDHLNNVSSSNLSTSNQNNEQIYNNANNGHHFLNTLPQAIINASQSSTTSSNYHNSNPYRTPTDSEFEFSNALYRHASTTSRLRNMYQDDSTADDLMDDESISSSSSSEEDSDDDQDEDESMFTGSFNWDASNNMDTSDDSDSEGEGYRQSFSRRSSSSSASPVFSSSDEDENDNESVVTTSTSNSRPEINQQWYKPWSWYNQSDSLALATSNASTIAAPDSDSTISSGDDFE
ncbi:10652_t:CDS:2 [Funneliformis mosseae]|uniref:10652_t:CDS:1 n=1 Tax=Funneliformis mosseae TaxID=27381 RepID=A0A9N9AUM0_FUNMO|nr:10652_t:CDS:2 [Funneliformis mosseae]